MILRVTKIRERLLNKTKQSKTEKKSVLNREHCNAQNSFLCVKTNSSPEALTIPACQLHEVDPRGGFVKYRYVNLKRKKEYY